MSCSGRRISKAVCLKVVYVTHNPSISAVFKGMTRAVEKIHGFLSASKGIVARSPEFGIRNLVPLVEGNGQTGYFVSENEKQVFSYPVIVYPVSPRSNRLPESMDFLQSDVRGRPILWLVESYLTHAPVNLAVNVWNLHQQIPTLCAVTSVTRIVLGALFQLILQKFRTPDK